MQVCMETAKCPGSRAVCPADKASEFRFSRKQQAPDKNSIRTTRVEKHLKFKNQAMIAKKSQ